MLSMSTYLYVPAVAASVVAVVAGYYTVFVSQKPKVYAGSLKLKKFLENHVKILGDKYSPSPLFWEGRLQTILGLILRGTNPHRLPYVRELFSLKDGGEVALDFAEVQKPKDGKSMVVLFFPGLTSSSQSCYVKTMVKSINESGASVVVFNNRGLGGVPFKTPRTYSASNCEDAVEVIKYLKLKYEGHRMIAIGTSLGGMVLSSYLISHPIAAKECFEAAVIVSIAWDCDGGTDNLETSLVNKYLINRELTRSLKALAMKFIKSVKEIPPMLDIKAILAAQTIRDFDTAVTAPQFGFASVADYYKSATIKGRVHKFPIPVFALNAEDDPMQPGRLLPTEEAEEKDSKLALVVTSHGGHLGFLEGVTKKEKHYLERFIGQLVTAIRLHGETDLKF